MSGSAGRARVRPLPDGGAHVGINWTRPRLSLPDGGGSRPPCFRWLSAGQVRRPLSSGFGGRAPHVPRHAPLAVCWTGVAFVVFRFRGTRLAMPRVRLLPDGEGSRPPCPRWLSAGRVRRPLSSGFGGRARMPRVRPGAKVLPGRGTR